MFSSIVRQVTARKFYNTVKKARALHPTVAENVHQYTTDEYSTMRCYLVSDDTAGFAIKSDGDMVNLFNLSTIRGLGAILFQAQVELGGEKLDCFEGYLTELYTSLGFIEYKREPNWIAGKPDVVYMAKALPLPAIHKDASFVINGMRITISV